MIGRLSLLALLCVAATPAYAAGCAAKIAPEAEAKATKFLNALVAGKTADAVAGVMGDSSMWASRVGAKEQIISQMDTAIKVYGAAVAWEPYCGDAIGTMGFREYYLVQHRETITRWEFDFARTSQGWKIAYFGFSDQVQTWF